MKGYTEGPWFAIGNSVYRRAKGELYEYGGGVAGDRPLAFVNAGWEEDGYPVEANANLIAAAPDMYEALVHIREIIMDGAQEGFNPLAGDWADRLFKSQWLSSQAVKKANPRDPLAEETRADLREHALDQLEEIRLGADDGDEA